MQNQSASRALGWGVRLIIDHNPFFLLSAICMMFGCTVLNIALYTPAGDVRNLLILLGVVNIYEAALIALGVLLIRRNGAERRDAHTLMGLEAVFLADSTFVAGVIATINVNYGWMLDGVLLALSLVKVMIVSQALKLPQRNRIIALVILQMLVVLIAPTLFKHIAMQRRGFLPELTVYLAWWVVGLLPVIGAALLWPGRPGASRTPAAQAQLILAGIYLVVPFLSVLMHVYGSGWVYNFYLKSPEVSPVLLGLAVALSALQAHRPGLRVVNWQVTLVVAAILCALYGNVTPSKTAVRTSISFQFAGLQVTAVRLTLLGSLLVVLHLIWLRRRLYAVIAGSVCALAAVLWPNLPSIFAMTMRVLKGGGSLLARLVPHTNLQWGVTGVVASFVLLALGAAFSLRRRPPVPVPVPEPGPLDSTDTTPASPTSEQDAAG